MNDDHNIMMMMIDDVMRRMRMKRSCYIFFVAPIICMVCNAEDNIYGGSGLSNYCSMVLNNKLRAVL